VKFLLDSITGRNWNPEFVDILTEVCFYLALALSLYTNFKDFRRRKASSTSSSGDILP
jgi:hypothetical protein